MSRRIEESRSLQKVHIQVAFSLHLLIRRAFFFLSMVRAILEDDASFICASPQLRQAGSSHPARYYHLRQSLYFPIQRAKSNPLRMKHRWTVGTFVWASVKRCYCWMGKNLVGQSGIPFLLWRSIAPTPDPRQIEYINNRCDFISLVLRRQPETIESTNGGKRHRASTFQFFACFFVLFVCYFKRDRNTRCVSLFYFGRDESNKLRQEIQWD